MGRALQADLFDGPAPALGDGAVLRAGHLGRDLQVALLDAAAEVIAAAPLHRPRMRNGTPLINQMTNCGSLGWTSDDKGYRYVARHPETDRPWPPIPALVRQVADDLCTELGLVGYTPDACLVNAYGPRGRLNLHTDHDEQDLRQPIVSISLGADAIFQLGGLARRDPTQDLVLRSGDVIVLHGPARMRYHGVRRIRPGTAPFAHRLLTPEIARINLTLRQAR